MTRIEFTSVGAGKGTSASEAVAVAESEEEVEEEEAEGTVAMVGEGVYGVSGVVKSTLRTYWEAGNGHTHAKVERMTVTLNEQEAEFCEISVAVTVIRVVPSGKMEPDTSGVVVYASKVRVSAS